MNKLIFFITLVLIASTGYPDSISQPLFQSDEVLAITLELPFYKLSRDRTGEPEYHNAQLSYKNDDDQIVSIPLKVRTRGKTRRDPKICKFPPLRLRFSIEPTIGTLFEHQKNMKLVTHCQNQGKFDQYVLKEYLAYRIYNLITDISIRPRLVRVSYLEEGDRQAGGFGILLENWHQVAARTGLTALATETGINQDRLRADDANRVSLFQYLISNDDWSLTSPVADDGCCHNMRPLLTPDNLVVPLPYDYDYSGLVNTPYAVAKSRHSNVRTRRYAGLCSTIGSAGLSHTISVFNNKRDDIEAEVRRLQDAGLRKPSSTIKYIDRFYDVINDPARIEKKLVKRCRKS